MTPHEFAWYLDGYHERVGIQAHFTAGIMNSNGMMKKSITGKDLYSYNEESGKLNQFTEEGKKEINERIKQLGNKRKRF